jgi:hypothetical protein
MLSGDMLRCNKKIPASALRLVNVAPGRPEAIVHRIHRFPAIGLPVVPVLIGAEWGIKSAKGAARAES